MSLQLKHILCANKCKACYSKVFPRAVVSRLTLMLLQASPWSTNKPAPDGKNSLPDNPYTCHAKANFPDVC